MNLLALAFRAKANIFTIPPPPPEGPASPGAPYKELFKN